MIPIEEIRETLVALHETPGIGRITIDRLLAISALDGARTRREGDWRELGLTAKQAAAAVENLGEARMEARRRRWARTGLSYVTALDAAYPARLRHIADAPWVLYYYGRLELAARPSVAIVGTRLATAYGRRVAEDLASDCARAGLTVVSGLAKGIDAAAHLGALQGPGSTVAVLGSPADTPYPPENRTLYRQIAEAGLIVSETPPDIPLHPGLFPLRNRIIAGLALGVVVVEAAERSGALITADLAGSYDRDVFVVPGPVTSPRSRGPLLRLRQNSAKPVLDASDILSEYPAYLNGGETAAERADSDRELTPEEARVYRILRDGPRSVDELSAEAGLTFGLLHAVLLSLQIKRKIHQQPGSVYNAL
ncbi:DNA-processing protein DprA [Cohnella nanjingensis]|uniref:DNA-protecting protein DprA n=1 Tax=Cohnella nanjingensis TaxID=1387779 RepID=A0A7X0RVS0_9BACL|nr:DNA-processing protein DprA [Cohnella nanjingensis]MBB6674583.1 DNA-protecting protein DprA [Cohnella nanjingensis]